MNDTADFRLFLSDLHYSSTNQNVKSMNIVQHSVAEVMAREIGETTNLRLGSFSFCALCVLRVVC